MKVDCIGDLAAINRLFDQYRDRDLYYVNKSWGNREEEKKCSLIFMSTVSQEEFCEAMEKAVPKLVGI